MYGRQREETNELLVGDVVLIVGVAFISDQSPVVFVGKVELTRRINIFIMHPSLLLRRD